jgi:hypothetical protein
VRASTKSTGTLRRPPMTRYGISPLRIMP